MGYMGSGKTTIGRKLSEILGFSFIDLDDHITSNESMEIKDIFKNKGEIYFRKKEADYLAKLLKEIDDIVLSLGGGTPCYGNNIDLINSSEKTKSIYLKASIPTLVSRLKPEQANRPLISHLKSENDLTEFIGKHLFERKNYYEKAHKVITTDNKPVNDIIESIIMHLI